MFDVYKNNNNNNNKLWDAYSMTMWHKLGPKWTHKKKTRVKQRHPTFSGGTVEPTHCIRITLYKVGRMREECSTEGTSETKERAAQPRVEDYYFVVSFIVFNFIISHSFCIFYLFN